MSAGAETPEAAEREATGQRRELVWTGAALVVFFAVLALALWVPDSNVGTSLGGDLTFFILLNLSVVFLIVLVFLVGRNLVRLTIDRRRGLFGSQLRTRLVILFIGMSLTPSFILVMVARGFLNEAIDSWFDTRVKTALQGAVDVADSYYLFAADDALQMARGLAAELAPAVDRADLDPGDAEVAARLERARAERNVAAVHLCLAGPGPRWSAMAAAVVDRVPPLAPGLPEAIYVGEEVAATIPVEGADFIRVGVPLRGAGGAVAAAVLVDVFVPEAVARTAREVSGAYADFLQTARLERPLRNQYALTLALIAVVVAFAAVWVGLRQARNITVPLSELARGTREVSQGNWKFRIAPARDRETDMLVDSFNRMTADLESSHAEIEARRKYAESILANIAAGVISLDREGVVTTVNPAAAAMLGLSREHAEGRHWSGVFAPVEPPQVGELVATLVEHPERLAPCQVRLAAGEQPITALVSATVLSDESGHPRGGMLFFENVTDLLRVQRMEAWREVARRLAHEIKNPLTPIKLSAQRLRRRFMERLDASEREVLDECTTTIVSQVDAMQRLVSEFSTFARLPAVELVPQDVNRVVGDAVALFRQGHADVEFRFVPGEGLPPVPLDRESLERVVINILDNAVAACEAAPTRAATVEIGTCYRADLEAVCLDIADNGCGMSVEVKHRVFEPYFSTKEDGTGLGMAIVAAIVADHRGYIRVHDNRPHGSRFSIHLPVRADDRREPDAPAA